MADRFHTPSTSVFKTPTSVFKTPSSRSDSEESSNGEPASNDSGSGDLTLVAEFDELIRLTRQQRGDDGEDALINVVDQLVLVVARLRETERECARLQEELDVRSHSLSDLESKLLLARKFVDQERRHSWKVENERDQLRQQIERVHEFLFREGRARIPEDAREKLSFLSKMPTHGWDPNAGTTAPPPLSIIKEGNTTGSLLSDFSYSRSEDDLNVSDLQSEKRWKKHRPSVGQAPFKKRKTSDSKVVEITNTDTVRATTTLTVPKNGPIIATSIIESIPTLEADGNVAEAEEFPSQQPPPVAQLEVPKTPRNETKLNLRPHSFQQRTVVMPDMCGPCEKRIRFGKTALKCKDCRTTCHPECKKLLPLPCIPFVNTPPVKQMMGFISDYTPTTPPMVPAIIVHCLNEIQSRGLNEIGIYRIPGAERDVKMLKEKFLRGKGSPCLNQVDIHVICGTVKDFLRSLQEPLITFGLWPRFVKCVETHEDPSALYSIVSKLPQPNRDTLAYVILHLKRVGDSRDCKMPISNLAKIFGPTIVGYSSSDPNQDCLITETRQQNMVMESLMNLPQDYWASFIDIPDRLGAPKLQQTPSTDSLLMPHYNTYTPHSARRLARKKQRFFPTPPKYHY